MYTMMYNMHTKHDKYDRIILVVVGTREGGGAAAGMAGMGVN